MRDDIVQTLDHDNSLNGEMPYSCIYKNVNERDLNFRIVVYSSVPDKKKTTSYLFIKTSLSKS